MANTKDRDSKAVPAVASVVVKELLRKATTILLAAANWDRLEESYQR